MRKAVFVPNAGQRRSHACAIIAAVVATVFVPTSVLAELPALPEIQDRVGLNIHFTDPRAGEMAMLASTGVRWIRMDLYWSNTERKRGEYDFSHYDRLLSALDAFQIRAILILDYANPLYDGGQSPSTDGGRLGFARWAAAAAAHFAGHGVIWEMYNEPNGHFWTPKPKPEDYVSLALVVAKAIHDATNGTAVQIGPAVSSIDFTFIEKCLSSGILKYWSAVSVHPYRQEPPESVSPEYARLRDVIAKYAPSGKRIPILCSEWGYSAAFRRFDDDKQARYLGRQWLVNVLNGVPISIWYDWHDDGPRPADIEHHFGTVRFESSNSSKAPFSPKPAFLAIQTLTTALRGFSFVKRMQTDRDSDFVLLFCKRDAGGLCSESVTLAVWTIDKDVHDIRIEVSPGRFRAVSYLGNRVPDVIAGDSGLHVSGSDGVLFVTPLMRNKLLWAESKRPGSSP